VWVEELRASDAVPEFVAACGEELVQAAATRTTNAVARFFISDLNGGRELELRTSRNSERGGATSAEIVEIS
jgi:hypothetical protein